MTRILREARWFITWYLPRWLISADFRGVERKIRAEDEFVQRYLAANVALMYAAMSNIRDDVVQRLSPLLDVIAELEGKP